ncbi:MAG: LamG domain-containing protein, partial [Planctomycetes bacterium]|nr:LamG domain-containing protein [Planctomycetota bacterium]
MKTRTRFFAAAMAGLTLTAWAGGPTNEAVRITIDLADGSRLLGTTEMPSVRLVSVIGTIALPIGTLTSVQFNPDRETVRVRLVNNDLLSGVLDLPVLPMQTLFGTVAVPMSQCRSLTFSCGRVDAGLVLHYTFDEDAEKVQDRSGLGHDGIVRGAKWTPQGRTGGAYVLDGKGYIDCGSSVALSPAAITYSVWIKPAVLEDYKSIIGKGMDQEKTWTWFYIKANGKLGCGLYANDNVAYDGTGSLRLTAGEWYHVAMVYDSETGLKGYINGKLDHSVPPKGALAAVPQPF